MKIINYEPVKGKYLPEEAVKQCFRRGKITHVNKVLCGNGFTHHFLNNPPETGLNFLVECNLQVIKNKQNQNTNPHIKFIYKGQGSDSRNLTPDVKIVVLTVNAFVKTYLNRLNYYDVNTILLDEMHTMIQQSTFRSPLKGLSGKLRSVMASNPSLTITTVTATPLLYNTIEYNGKTSKDAIDIKLIANHSPEFKIHINNNFLEAIDYINSNKDKKIVVFTNSKKIIMNLAEKQNHRSKSILRANKKLGATLFNNLSGSCEFIDNDNLHVISSAGMEGFDLDGEGREIFFFQDFNNTHEQLLLSNIYQALSRTRQGYLKATYCRIDADNERPIDDIIKAIEKKKIKATKTSSISKLKRNARLSWSDANIVFDAIEETTEERGLTKFNEERTNYLREKQLFSKKGIEAKEFESFLKDRNIVLVNENIITKNAKRRFTLDYEYYHKANASDIKNEEADKEVFYFNTSNKRDEEAYSDIFYKRFRKFLSLVTCGEITKAKGKYKVLADYMSIYDNDRTEFNLKVKALIDGNIKAYTKEKRLEIRKNKNYPERVELLREKIDLYKANAERDFLLLLGVLSNPTEKMEFTERPDGYRDYNCLASAKKGLLEEAVKIYNMSYFEADIKSCAIRVLYAECGKALPLDIYGINKEKKEAVNVCLNTLSYQAFKKGSNHKYNKQGIKRKLQRLGIDNEVIDFAVANFYHKDSDEFFYFYTKREKEIIEKLKSEWFFTGTRKHDALILFEGVNNLNYKLSEFEYKGFKGWFDDLEFDISEEDLKVLDMIDNPVEEVFESKSFAPIPFQTVLFN